MSRLVEHAKTELSLLAGEEPDTMQELVNKDVLELIEVFSKQRHSGTTAHYVLEVFYKLADFKTLTPISFEDKWWNAVGPTDDTSEQVYQHARNTAVFKQGKDGRPYYIYAYTKCWESDPSCCWHGSLDLKYNKKVGKCYIKDPAKMPTIKLLVPIVSTGPETSDWEFLPIDESKLEELKQFYDLEIVEE